MIFDNYTAKYKRGKQINGPFFPKRADLIVKRTVRGMIPFKSSRRQGGLQAPEGIRRSSQGPGRPPRWSRSKRPPTCGRTNTSQWERSPSTSDRG